MWVYGKMPNAAYTATSSAAQPVQSTYMQLVLQFWLPQVESKAICVKACCVHDVLI